MDNKVWLNLLFAACVTASPLCIVPQSAVPATVSSVAGTDQQQTAPPSVNLSFAKSERIPINLSEQGLSLPLHCVSDGSIAFESVNFGSPGAPSGQGGSSIYAVRSATHLTRFGFEGLDLKKLMPAQTFAISDQGLYAIVSAVTSDEDFKDKNSKVHPFLVHFDRGGSFKSEHAIEDVTGISAMGLFPSGEILVTSIDTNRHFLRWMVIGEDGRLIREITPNSEEPRKDDLIKMLQDDAMSLVPQIAPYRGHLLTIATGGKEVFEWNPYGVIRTTKLESPAGMQNMNFISSNGRNWLIAFGHQEAIPEMGGDVGLMPTGIGEYDPATGTLLRILHTELRHNGTTIACENDGAFESLSTDPKDGTLLIDTGTAEK